MKKTYLGTFLPGIERPIEAMLHKEGGVAVERVLPGAAVFKSVREPALPYMRQTFQLLFQMKPVASVDDALKRLLNTGGWLDRFPYEETQGKRFRIVTAFGDQLVGANMRFVDMLERAICDNTGMRTQRERPEVELWVLCRPEAAYFLWRIGKRAVAKQEGQLRADVCSVISFLAQASAKNVTVLGCKGASLPAALASGGSRVTCVCPTPAAARAVSRGASGVRVLEGESGHTGLEQASQRAVVLYLPSNLETDDRATDALRSALYEARRILEAEGRLIVLAALAPTEGALRRARGFHTAARYLLTLGGQKSAIWLMEPIQEIEENEQE